MSSGSEDEDTEGKEEEDDLPPLIRIRDEKSEPPERPEESDFPPLAFTIGEVWRPVERVRSEEEEVPDPLTFRGRTHPGWRSLEEGIEQRHQGRHQAFQNRRSQVKRETYVESLKPSPITEQMEWESVEKGSSLWKARQAIHWKLEIERMFIPWPVKADVKLEQMDERREWMLSHLEIPFLRYPRREENAMRIIDLRDNSEAIQEMVAKNCRSNRQ
jgi:hypothetical protein